MGIIILSLAMTVSGIGFAFVRGWSFALVSFGSFPFVFLISNWLVKLLLEGY